MTLIKPIEMRIKIDTPVFLTKLGKRVKNEDYVFPISNLKSGFEPNRIFLVCDGVGGADKGEVASRYVCEGMYGHLSETENIGINEIQEGVVLSQRKIDGYLFSHELDVGMATTMTLLVINDKGVLMAHIGDSRIYQIRDNQIVYKSQDHSIVNEMVLQNLITLEEAASHPQKNVITKAISGTAKRVTADIEYTSDIQKGDYFLLCTDGVLESFTDETLVQLLANPSISNSDKVNHIDAVCSEKSKDNFSLFLVQISSVELED